MRQFEDLGRCIDWLSDFLMGDNEDMYRYVLECPTRYKPSRDERLRKQLVPTEGALSHVEGLVLYAIARATKVKRIVELGTYAGHSTNYLAEAARANGGRVDTVDLVRYWGGVIRGQAITLKNRMVVRQHKADAQRYLLGPESETLDMIFEDTSHTYIDTRMLINAAMFKLKRGGILAIHDVAVTEVEGCEVQKAVDDSGLDFISFKVWPGEQGIALWRRP